MARFCMICEADNKGISDRDFIGYQCNYCKSIICKKCVNDMRIVGQKPGCFWWNCDKAVKDEKPKPKRDMSAGRKTHSQLEEDGDEFLGDLGRSFKTAREYEIFEAEEFAKAMLDKNVQNIDMYGTLKSKPPMKTSAEIEQIRKRKEKPPRSMRKEFKL